MTTTLPKEIQQISTHNQALHQAIASGHGQSHQSLQTMKAIRETMGATGEQLGKLDSSTQQIAGAINLIRQFAAQTHLLALKASIEAARAGEEGRGFSVIADEVRGLAAQSAEATAAIEALVVTIQSQARELTTTIKQSNQQLQSESQGLEMAQDHWQECLSHQQQLAQSLELLQKLG
jgi:methyl-accepting chemotaxis protein PixJ